MKTVKLYDINPYRDEFTAKVISCTKSGENYEAVLDETLFFPEEGGQDADKGVIKVAGISKEIPVLDVKIREDVIYHILPESIEEGSEVTGKIDYERRFDYMQQHSGEHIISGLAHKLYGCNNVGFHLSEREVTLDFDRLLSPEEVKNLELKANECVQRDIPVKAYYPDEATLAGLDYRSKKELTGPVRIVEIEGVDMCACCAPHVKSTGRIGIIKFVDFIPHRGGMRITICCGMRGVKDYVTKQDVVSRVSAALSAPTEKIPDALDALFADRLRVNEERIKAGERYLKILTEAATKENGNVVIFGEGLDTKLMRDSVNDEMAKRDDYIGVFNGNDSEGYNFIIGSKVKDCMELAGKLRSELDAKCGGKNPMIQGSIKATALEIRKFF